MTRMALIKVLVGSGALIFGSSDANALVKFYKNLSCTYSNNRVAAGRVPAITLWNTGKATVPKNSAYIVRHANPDATVHFRLGRPLGPQQRATVPIQQNLGKSTSQCTAQAAVVLGGI